MPSAVCWVFAREFASLSRLVCDVLALHTGTLYVAQ